MKQLLFLSAITSITILCSCDRELHVALDQSGDNRSEIEAVLKHYEDEGDDFKLNAAKFLIRNMPYNHCSEGEAIEAYDSLILKTAGISDNKRTQYFNENLALIKGGNHLAVDISHVKADYLIRMIDRACDTWRNASWSKDYDQEVFYEYVLPYRLNNEILSDWHQGIDAEFPYYKQASLLSRRGVQYEAEKAEGIVCETIDALGTSEGKSVLLKGEDSELRFHISSVGEASRRLILKYACADTLLQALLKVNGTVVGTLRLAPTRNSFSYKEKWFNTVFPLTTGGNVISIASPSRPLRVDYIQLGVVEPYQEENFVDLSKNYWRIKIALTSTASLVAYDRYQQSQFAAANPLLEENLEALADPSSDASNTVSPYVLTPFNCESGRTAYYCISTTSGTYYLTNQIDCDGDRWSPNNPYFDNTFSEN